MKNMANADEVVKHVCGAGSFVMMHDETKFYFAPRSGHAVDTGTDAFARTVRRLTGIPRGEELAKAVERLKAIANETTTKVRIEYNTAFEVKDGVSSLYINFGNGTVLRFQNGSSGFVPNAADGILFLDEDGFEPLDSTKVVNSIPSEAPKLPTFCRVILEHLPPPAGSLTSKEQAALVMATWFGVFIGCLATARPATLFVGEPGSGKSVTQRLLAKAFFGPEGNTTGGTQLDRVMKDIAASAAYSSLVIRDDLHDFPAGGLDVLSRIITGTTFRVAGYFKTLAEERFPVRALLVLSAVRPKWFGSRADLMSRFLLLKFKKGAPTPITEAVRVRAVLDARAAIWAETAVALGCLCNQLPERTPVTRFDDWERIQAVLLQQAGWGDAFESALRKLSAESASLAVESDPLVHYLWLLACDPQHRGRRWLASDLAHELAVTMGASDQVIGNAAGRLTQNPQSLAKFLGQLRDQGSAVVEVANEEPKTNNTLRWTLTPKVRSPE